MPKYRCISLKHIFVCLYCSLKFYWNVMWVEMRPHQWSPQATHQWKPLFPNPGVIFTCRKVPRLMSGYYSSVLSKDFSVSLSLLRVSFLAASWTFISGGWESKRNFFLPYGQWLQWRVVLLLQCFLILTREICSPISAVLSAFVLLETEGRGLVLPMKQFPCLVTSAHLPRWLCLFSLLFSFFLFFFSQRKLTSLRAGWRTG